VVAEVLVGGNDGREPVGVGLVDVGV
jgi:hypothetical protein